MRRKENSFLRLLFYGSGKGGENRNLILLFFYFFFSFDLRGKGRGKRVKQGRKGKRKDLVRNEQGLMFLLYFFLLLRAGAREKIFAPNGNFGLPLNSCCHGTIKTFPKGQIFFLSPFPFPFLFSPIFLLSFPLYK